MLELLDCDWDGGLNPSNTSSHQLTLTALPVDSSVWTRFVASAPDGVTGTTFTQCDSDGGYNTCQYDAYVNGSWFELDATNIIPSSSSFSVLPPAVMGIVSTMNAQLNTGAALVAPSTRLTAERTADMKC